MVVRRSVAFAAVPAEVEAWEDRGPQQQQQQQQQQQHVVVAKRRPAKSCLSRSHSTSTCHVAAANLGLNRSHDYSHSHCYPVSYFVAPVPAVARSRSSGAMDAHHGHHGHHDSGSSNASSSNPHITFSQADPVRHEDHSFRTRIDTSYEGWDNPFRPNGELSHEAEELLRQWKEKKSPALPADLHSEAAEADGRDVTDADHNKQQQHGHAHHHAHAHNGAGAGGADVRRNTRAVEVKRDTVSAPAPASAAKVHLEDNEPKKKKGCCTVM